MKPISSRRFLTSLCLLVPLCNEKGDILDGVDGRNIRSLEDLFRGMGKVKDHEKITLRLKRFADPPVDSVFEYIEQTIKVEDLRWISQRPAPGS